MLARTDLAIVGAGVVGLAHAVEALRRGLSVVIVERNDVATGTSGHSVGHLGITGHAGDALNDAFAARQTWLQLAKDAGFWISDGGSLVAVTSEAEYAVLEELYDLRGDQVVLLDRDDVADYAPVGPDVVGGGWFPFDLRIDPGEALPAIARWLRGQGVRIHWATTSWAVEPGLVRTDRGEIAADAVVVAARDEIHRLFPGPPASAHQPRCGLRVTRVDKPYDGSLEPALVTGLAIPRWAGFQACPSLHLAGERIAARHPELVAAGVDLSLVQRPDGDLVIGDSRTGAPADDASLDAAVLAEVARLLGVERLTVRERWHGTYTAPDVSQVVGAPSPDVRVVGVTEGVGMTTAFGLAPRVLDGLVA
jgi:D-hydroxyproline dehydrogenase subunit beta